MDSVAILLSRVQFGFTISFHILFPVLTIGMAIYIAFLESMWMKTRNEVYKKLCLFWSKIFALSFGMGVVTGIVLSYEVGTNFSRFADAAGNVIGPLFAYEVMTAFFLEAGFLGIMLFGWNRVGPRLHYTATLLVALGTTISAFWILAANSWMQTPAGAELRDGVFYPTDWMQVVFNPSFPYRFAHMLLASLLTTTFFVAGICAWYVLKGHEPAFAARALKLALLTAALLAPLQIFMGDQHGLNAYEYQPMKVAAMEAHWETGPAVPLLLFALPDEAAGKNRYALGIPYGTSLLLEHSFTGVVPGLKDVPPGDRPPVTPVFFAFRAMVGLGLLMLLIAWLGVFYIRRGVCLQKRGYLRCVVAMAPAGFIATVSGWYVAEAGRQPWVVYHLMRTADAVSPVSAGQVWTSLTIFVAVYCALLAAYLFYLLRIISQGPGTGVTSADKSAIEQPLSPETHGRPAFLPAEDR